MRRVTGYAILASLGLLLVPAAAAGDLQATGATGLGGVTSADAPTVRFRPDGPAFILDVSIGDGGLILVDEVIEHSWHLPGSDVSAAGQKTRAETPLDAPAHAAVATRSSDEDAVAVIVPVGRTPYASNVAAASEFSVEPVAAQVLEASHARSDTTVGNDPFEYYEFGVPDILRWESQAGANLRATGDFDIYLWGIPFTLTGANGTTEHRTGFSIEANDSTGGLTTDDHYRYARILVRGGSLDISGDGTLEMFAPAFRARPLQVTFQGADGTVPGRSGTFRAEGTVTSQAGAYQLVYQPGGMDIDVTEAPLQTSGPQVRYIPTPWHEGAWFLPILAVTILIVGSAAALYSHPTVSGLRQLRYMESLTGDWRQRGWRKARAHGYALMAAAAEEAGQPRRATLWMAFACRLDPDDPSKRIDLGILQAACGRHRAALRNFKAAYDDLLKTGDPDSLLHNAMEAAHAAAEGRLPEEAIEWLRIAVRLDASVTESIASDPVFARLRRRDDFAWLAEA